MPGAAGRGRRLGLAPHAFRRDERLAEIAFGDWEGFTIAQLHERDPARIAQREHDKWHFVPPGGESYAMLAERVSPILDDLRRQTVMVAHGGVARALLAVACGISTRNAASLDIWQGKVLVIEGRRHSWA